MQTEETKEKRSTFAAVIITQFICVTLIFLSLFVLKKFFAPTYKAAEKFIKSEMFTGTDTEEILSYFDL